MRKDIPKLEVKLSSKALTEIVKGGVITQETIAEIDTLKISVTKEEQKVLAEDFNVDDIPKSKK